MTELMISPATPPLTKVIGSGTSAAPSGGSAKQESSAALERVGLHSEPPPGEAPRARAPVVVVTQPQVAPARRVEPPAPAPAEGAAMPKPAPTIQVTIGRVEVRATPPPAPARKKQRPKPPVMNLDEYLRQRANGGNR